MGRNDTLITPDGASIRERRRVLGISVQTAAVEASVSVSTWSNAERSHQLSDLSVAKITQALDRLESGSRKGPRMVEVSEDRLDAVLEEVRSLRRLVEDLATPPRSDQ